MRDEVEENEREGREQTKRGELVETREEIRGRVGERGRRW
jgi:hypothetical protein